jgi:hypothetical protein
MRDPDPLYEGGFDKLMRFLDKRQRPFGDPDAALPAADIDLRALFDRKVAAPPQHFDSAERYSAHRKWLELQAEFEGQPEILHLHAMLIACSRRNAMPPAAETLFFRIWDEHGAALVDLLDVRWMISSATTFADIGRSGDQRALGMGLSTLFDLIKLHDSERRVSGQPGKAPFRFSPEAKRFPIPFKMPPYSLAGGDLDKVMLARLWQLTERDATIRPLGRAMLRMVMTDPRSIFGRVQEFKRIRANRES